MGESDYNEFQFILFHHGHSLQPEDFIGVGGGGGTQRGHCAPPPPKKKKWKPEIRAKCGKNSGKIRAKIWAKKKVTKIKKRQKREKSSKFTQKERKISCIFNSIKLFENISQELARIFVQV